MLLCLVFLMVWRLVVTCWERADLLARVGDVYCVFVTFLCGIFGQVWYLIISFPDLCLLSYFVLTLLPANASMVLCCVMVHITSRIANYQLYE